MLLAYNLHYVEFSKMAVDAYKGKIKQLHLLQIFLAS